MLWTVWWISVSVRVVNSVLVQTFFSPDEYWQSLEPAHVAVFGYGELTWEWRHHIRSFLHPLVYALLFALLDLLSLDQSFLITLAPNLLNALFAALADLSTFRLASLLFGQGPARWAVCHPLLPFSPTPPLLLLPLPTSLLLLLLFLPFPSTLIASSYLLSFFFLQLFCSYISWFNFFCLTRSFSNTMEAVITIAALSYWPWRDHGRGRGFIGKLLARFGQQEGTTTGDDIRVATALITLSFIIRPTSAILWLPLVLNFLQVHLFELPKLIIRLGPIV